MELEYEGLPEDDVAKGESEDVAEGRDKKEAHLEE